MTKDKYTLVHLLNTTKEIRIKTFDLNKGNKND